MGQLQDKIGQIAEGGRGSTDPPERTAREAFDMLADVLEPPSTATLAPGSSGTLAPVSTATNVSNSVATLSLVTDLLVLVSGSAGNPSSSTPLSAQLGRACFDVLGKLLPAPTVAAALPPPLRSTSTNTAESANSPGAQLARKFINATEILVGSLFRGIPSSGSASFQQKAVVLVAPVQQGVSTPLMVSLERFSQKEAKFKLINGLVVNLAPFKGL